MMRLTDVKVVQVVLAAGTAALLATACGSDASTSTPGGQPQEGSVSGQVMLGPTCPVQKVGETCTRPYSNAHVVFRALTRGRSKDALADADGRYSIALEVGEYEAQAQGGTPFPRGIPKLVRVEAGSSVVLDLTADTGIR